MLNLANLVWRKSTRSGVNGCVEVAFLDDQVAVRDSKRQHPAVLLFTRTEWQAFLTGVRDGEFDWPDNPSGRAAIARPAPQPSPAADAE